MMTNDVKNIWSDLSNNSSIRIEIETPFNFFWIKDMEGRYGFHIRFDHVTFSDPIIEKLKGITIIKGTKQSVLTDFALWLNNKNDHQLFASLCHDLIAVSSSCIDEFELLHAVNNRLKKWQRFLSNDSSFLMSEQKQMGLFGELLCLKKYIVPKLGFPQSLISWVGPDYHKQDFSLQSYSIEVKAFISSKGPFVNISSAHQLLSDSPLYLFAFGLTRDEKGLSIYDLINDVKSIIAELHGDQDMFDEKLSEYGYIDGITIGPFVRFGNDQIKAFTVAEGFPKILPGSIDARITTVEYSIDLSKCNEFKVEPYSVLN
jgi:hypothetical protein